MFSMTDIKSFEDVCRPFLKHNVINPELFDTAFLAVKNKIKGNQDRNPNQLPKLLKRSEVAELLKCSEKQVDRLRKAGKLQTIKYSPRSVLMRLEDVERLISAPI